MLSFLNLLLLKSSRIQKLKTPKCFQDTWWALENMLCNLIKLKSNSLTSDAYIKPNNIENFINHAKKQFVNTIFTARTSIATI